MTDLNDPRGWAEAFGLAEAALFGERDGERQNRHRILLDGGSGTFMLSIIDVPDQITAASWAWSSNVVHHVGVTPDHVTLVRWDHSGPPRRFTKRSVAAQLEAFYTFLLNDSVERGRSIVPHMVELFRSVRAATNDAKAPDTASLGAFLLALDDLAAEEGDTADRSVPPFLPPDDAARSVYATLREGPLQIELDRFRRAHVGTRSLDLHAALSIRHAGGLIFQEAHFELLRAPTLDLLGQARDGRVGPSRGGAHFTPPAIARSIVEQALTNVANLEKKQELVVLDPACGSGAFLHETLRALQRTAFCGQVKVIGRDVSEPAISMARFVLNHAVADWVGKPVLLDVQIGDSLAAPLPAADVIVMNPPFISFSSLDSQQREHMRRILGRVYKGRPDLSMAFITHALASLKKGGALGCLFPGSLLSLEGAADWRRSLIERGGLRFLASIGDFALFEYALVQVAAAVFANGPDDGRFITLWTSNDAGATGAALRQLRKERASGAVAEESKNWRLGRAARNRFATLPDWRLRAPRIEKLLEELEEALPTRVSDLFNVRQGIRTGANEIFILTRDALQVLPESEHRFFRDAITNTSIRDGVMELAEYVFYPYERGKLLFGSEAELAKALPTYFARYLEPNKEKLSTRSTVAKRGKPWWSLAEARAFETGGKPRVVSKYFGGLGGFAVDQGSSAAVVQGQSWYPHAELIEGSATAAENAPDFVSHGFVQAYGALFNTHLFTHLLDAFSAPVAGGQYDLSKRYVDPVNLPHLGRLFADSRRRAIVIELERLGADIRLHEPEWLARADQAAADAYGITLDILAQP